MELICFRSRPLLEPEKGPPGFSAQGRGAGPEPRAGRQSLPSMARTHPLIRGSWWARAHKKQGIGLPQSLDLLLVSPEAILGLGGAGSPEAKGRVYDRVGLPADAILVAEGALGRVRIC